MRKSIQALKYAVTDFVASAVVWGLFNLIRYEEIARYEGFDTFASYVRYDAVWQGQLLIPFFWLALFWLSGYYNSPYGKSRLAELFTTLISVGIGVILLFFVFVLNDLPKSYNVYYVIFFSLLGLQFVGIYLPRLFITQSSLRLTRRGLLALNVLVIGSGREAVLVGDDLTAKGYRVVGFVGTDEETEHLAQPCLGSLGSVSSLILEHKVDEIVVALDAASREAGKEIIYSLYRYKLPVKILINRQSYYPKVKINAIQGIPLVDMTANNFSDAEKNIKLVFDKAASALALLLLSPLFVYIAWRVKRDSEGPVLFKQERIGYLGRPFMIYKFRTMRLDAEKAGPLLSKVDDERITPFGHILRKYRLDELPQFWNVLKGDMSLVGPRPERKYFIDQIVRRVPYYYLLHNVRPGITSLGMVKYGYAGNVDQMIERLEYDMLYYENMSLAMDLKILIYTVITVVTGKGI